MSRSRVHTWAEVDGDVVITFEVEPGGGAVRFVIGGNVELYADADALAKVAEFAGEASRMATESAAGKCGCGGAPPKTA